MPENMHGQNARRHLTLILGHTLSLTVTGPLLSLSLSFSLSLPLSLFLDLFSKTGKIPYRLFYNVYYTLYIVLCKLHFWIADL